MSAFEMGLCIAAGVLGGLLLIWFIFEFNKFIRLKNKADKALSNMDVYFKKRHDLVPNLVETVKGYAKHEKELIEQVTQARADAVSSKKGEKRARFESKLGNAVGNLVAVAENYPELKANENFLELSKELSKMEVEIADARQEYNEVATELNTRRQTFPSSIAAVLMGIRKRTLFKASHSERENVKVKF